MSDSIRILVVDDERDHAQMVVRFLELSEAWPSAHLAIATTFDDAARDLASNAFDVAFVDYRLGSRSGLDLLRRTREAGADTSIVVLTGQGDEEVAVEAMRAGAADYLSKLYVTREALERTVHHALALRDRERQRRAAETALRENEERFRALVENSSDALILLDVEGRVTYLSASTVRQLGWPADEILGRSIFDFMHPDDREVVGMRMAEVLRRPGERVTQDVRMRHKDGTWRVMEGVGVNRLSDPVVRAIVVNARDITDRRKLEEQLWHAQKMEAVGQLAGGVAHDFNNLLTAILGYCNLALDDAPTVGTLRSDLEEIRNAGERAASLTRQLLAFSRRQMLQPQIVDVNTLVTSLLKLLRRLMSEDVEVTTTLGRDLPVVRADPASLEQVIVNLAVNARDAMERGGRITIETSAVDLDTTFTAAHVPMAAGRYVLLSVADTGTGMDAATRSRIFEPFFTTKTQGKGVGLGLATVYGIVKQNGGFIWVESEPGQGAVFRVYLPPAEVGASVRLADTSGSTRDRRRRGWETVLLVEDEDAVRALAREVLRRHGYVVLEARHGVEALRLAERHPDEIHLLIADIVMPHMSGSDLAKRLAADRPSMRVLFMSGYTERAAVHRDPTVVAAFVQKPFTPEAFARKVRNVLDTKEPTAAN
jgi:PAS domain S-box-containing protein